MNGNKLDVQKIVLWALEIVTVALLSLTLWIAKGVLARQDEMDKRASALELWQAEIKGSQFTAADGREVWREIAAIRQEMLKQEPPVWLKETLTELKSTLRSMDDRLRAMESRGARPPP